jgi:hypothetical protein
MHSLEYLRAPKALEHVLLRNKRLQIKKIVTATGSVCRSRARAFLRKASQAFAESLLRRVLLTMEADGLITQVGSKTKRRSRTPSRLEWIHISVNNIADHIVDANYVALTEVLISS